ncbi:hypothetical protein BCA37_25655 [Mycobacterium sp. djl-10]|nr:hypothetical protein BCA37_25655 [Mycobacterium sp. djl-10]
MTHLQSVGTLADSAREALCRFTFTVDGGTVSIETAEPLPTRITAEVADLVHLHQRSFSRSQPGSLVETMARSDGDTFEFPAESHRLFGLFDAVAAATGTPPWVLEVDRSGTTLSTSSALSVDVGATGTGHLVDLVTELLHRHGTDDFVLDAPNGLRHSGSVPLPIALRHPGDSTLAVGVATVTDQALCTTAANSDGPVSATWVVAAEAATANALGTELFSTPPARLARYFRFSYVRLFHDGHAEISRTFPGALFTK